MPCLKGYYSEVVMDKEINIRKASNEDLYDIQKLNNELFELEYHNFDSTLIENWPLSKEGEEYFKNAIKNNIVLVATLNNVIIGYLAGTLNSQYSYNNVIQAELDNMCIMKEYRRFGIGRQLFKEFKKICKDNKINEIKVVASYSNTNAIDFYKRNGFIESEVTLKQNLN